MKLGLVPPAAFIGALLLAPATYAAKLEPASVIVGGEQRDYITVSADAVAQGPRPLVLLLHGHIGTAANALGSGKMPSPLSAWIDIVDREQLLVVAPQGLKGSDRQTGWRDCRSDNTTNPRVDDVAFVSAVVHRLVEAKRVDPSRVYAMGMSNGAMMTHRLALEMRPAPAAIAAVSGTLAAKSDCKRASRAVSVLLIHGTNDPLVPYGGGAVSLRNNERGLVIGVAATRDYWLKADHLENAIPVAFDFPHGGTDPSHAVRTTYGGDAGPQVVVLTIQGGGHIEPSLRFHYGPWYSRFVGLQNRDLESAEEAWAFFRTKSRQ